MQLVFNCCLSSHAYSTDPELASNTSQMIGSRALAILAPHRSAGPVAGQPFFGARTTEVSAHGRQTQPIRKGKGQWEILGSD